MAQVGPGMSGSYKKQYLYLYKKNGVKPRELAEAPECPEFWRFLWGWFLELQHVEKLTFTEVKNWADIMGRDVLPWQVDVLMNLASIRTTVELNHARRTNKPSN